MRLVAAAVLAVFLCGSSYLADSWQLEIISPDKDAVFTEPICLAPRGQVWGSKYNQQKEVTAYVEFWHQETGKESVLINKTNFTAVAGDFKGFGFDYSPQLKAGKGWVGLKIVDPDGKLIDWTIHNYTVNPPIVVPTGPPLTSEANN